MEAFAERRRPSRLGRLRERARRHPRWLEWLLRAGYVAKGALYVMIGATGLLVAVGRVERARGSSDAVRLLVELPLGRILVGVLTVGLVGYSALSFVAAVRAPEFEEGSGGGGGGLFVRAADALSGVVYAGLAALAVRVLADPEPNAPGASGGLLARALLLPGAPLAVGAAGVVTLGAAAYLAYRAATYDGDARLERRGMGRGLARAVAAAARLGTAARAALFGVCGWLLVRAAGSDPGEGRAIVADVGDALDTLGDAPAGAWLVGAASVGCLSYGMYQLAKARWRKITL